MFTEWLILLLLNHTNSTVIKILLAGQLWVIDLKFSPRPQLPSRNCWPCLQLPRGSCYMEVLACNTCIGCCWLATPDCNRIYRTDRLLYCLVSRQTTSTQPPASNLYNVHKNIMPMYHSIHLVLNVLPCYAWGNYQLYKANKVICLRWRHTCKKVAVDVCSVPKNFIKFPCVAVYIVPHFSCAIILQ